MKTSEGCSRSIAARMAGRSRLKSAESGTPTKRIPAYNAFMEYMTNDGSGASMTAPGRASAEVMIWISSSEPLPSNTACRSEMPSA